MSARVVVAFALGLFATSAGAYTVSAGDLLVKPVAGAAVNVVRFPAATRATPTGGMVLGIDVDYSFDGPINFTAAFRPVLSPNYVDGDLGVGVKYRAVQLGAPFIPYASLMLTTALGGPLGAGDIHYNLGGRLAGGVDYFVMRTFAVGIELSAEVTGLLTPVIQPEATTEILAGVSWRF
jgi:hypothetical protein